MTNQNPSLEDVRARRRQIAEEDRELAVIEAGLVKLAQLWAARDMPPASREMPTPTLAPEVKRPATSATVRRTKTKNQLIIEALNVPRPLWQTANEIQSYMTGELGTPYPMSSVSPALTALKNSNTIVRKDMFVALALRVEKEEPDFLKENEPPEGGSETGELAGSPIETQPHENANG